MCSLFRARTVCLDIYMIRYILKTEIYNFLTSFRQHYLNAQSGHTLFPKTGFPLISQSASILKAFEQKNFDVDGFPIKSCLLNQCLYY